MIACGGRADIVAHPLNAIRLAIMDGRGSPVVALQLFQMIIQMHAGIHTLIDRQSVQADRIGKLAQSFPFGGAGGGKLCEGRHGNGSALVEP